MKVTLYNAISIDGFIADSNDGTSWVSKTDWKFFNAEVKASKTIVMGRRTYEAGIEDFPYACDLNIVATRDESLQKEEDNTLFSSKPPKQIIEEVKSRGFDTLLVIGGGKLNYSFLSENLIDEIILSVHPIILGKGIKLFDALKDLKVELEFLSSKELDEGLVQIRYKVKK